MSTLERLKQRKIVEWSLAYLAAAWFVLQFVDVLSEHWPLPVTLVRGIDLVLLVGFFAAVTISWYHGERGRQHIAGTELLILAALLVIAGLLLSLLKDDAAPPEAPAWSPTVSVPAIAVLPFRGLSDEPVPAYFEAGLHEALTASLAQIEGLRVIARTSLDRYADSDRKASEIARDLGASAIIDGSINAIGDRVRITIQLIDGGSDTVVWAGEYDRDLRDVLVMMSLVAATVAEHIEVSLKPDEQERLESAAPVDPAVYELYMRGRYAYSQFSGEGLARAMEFFQRAIEIDPDYAPAWAGLSGTHILGRYLGHETASEPIAIAERAAKRALELDPELAMAYTALAWIRLFQFEWEEARQLLARSLDLNPNEVDALHGYGDYLTITGSPEDGLAYVERARENDPFSPVWGHSVVVHLFLMRRYEDAIAEARNVIEETPTSPAQIMLGHTYWQLGQREEAIAVYRKALARRPGLLDALEAGYADGGPVGAVRAVAGVSAEGARRAGTVTLRPALWYARAGYADETVRWLQAAFEDRAPDLIYLVVRPELEFVQEHPGFLDIIERMRLTAYRRQPDYGAGGK